ncbi:Crp/Fnr family transcriptional regulator [Mucilaginibacter sp. R-33]|uniref:Crp/Fnr family transcriptional regulator n=1 Tax=Mucilaginibacter sp. R-33 TaxID=3416711 RepID=UPI003CF90C63
METSIFQRVYANDLLKGQDYEGFCKAHVKVDVIQGTSLLKAGKIAREFYLIENGVFRSCLYNYDGNEVTTEFYCQNDILIESFSLFHRMASKENFQAVTNGTVWKIDYIVFEQFLYKMEGLREWGRIWSTNQLYLLKQRSIDSLTITATERYLNLIKDRPEIVRHCPLKYIASYLGITDTSLSRIRKEITTA